MVYNPLKQMVGIYHHGPTNEPVSLTTPPGEQELNIFNQILFINANWIQFKNLKIGPKDHFPLPKAIR